MKLEINDYIRIDGFISKIDYIKKSKNGNEYVQFKQPNGMIAHINSKLIEKARHNILDLIEPHDLIIGIDGHIFEVYAIGSDCVYINGLKEFILKNEIKGILTHEQIENSCYKIGE